MTTIKKSQRGFNVGDSLEGLYGGTIRAYESSGMTPAIWVQTGLDTTPNGEPLASPVETTILLDLSAAENLRDQLTYLIENHFTRDIYPELYENKEPSNG